MFSCQNSLRIIRSNDVTSSFLYQIPFACVLVLDKSVPFQTIQFILRPSPLPTQTSDLSFGNIAKSIFLSQQIFLIQLTKPKMNTFDPFFSSDYKKTQNQTFQMEAQPELTKKSESQFLSQILSYSFGLPTNEIVQKTSQNTQLNVLVQRESEDHKSEAESSSSRSDDSKKKYSKNSPFHNFQKHLVISLRQILTFQKASSKIGVEYEVASLIFRIFKNSPKTSRKFLEHIYGLTDCNQFEKTEQNMRKGELKQLLQNYQVETIVLAQQILRDLTRLQLEQSDLKQCLSHRKIQKKSDFIEYMNLFKKELVIGKQKKKTYKLLAKTFTQKKETGQEDATFDVSY